MKVIPLPIDGETTPALPETGAVLGQAYDLKQTAALIKKRLTQLYPGVKFSVRGSWFSMGNAIDVSWVDGPPTKPVKAFLDQFKEGYYDSQEESYKYVGSGQFSGKYISGSRSYSSRYFSLACQELDLTQGAPDVYLQLHAVGENLLNRGYWEAGRNYGVKVENGNYLFTMAPARDVETWADKALRTSLEAQGYQVEAGEEAGEYVLAAYRQSA